MFRCLSWLSAVLFCLVSVEAQAAEFVAARAASVLDQPNGPKTIGQIQKDTGYPLLKRGGPGQTWCKLKVPAGIGWVRCEVGTVRGEASPSPEQRGPSPEQRGPSPGQSDVGFDYYLLSLSWSPTYCETHQRGEPEQCSIGKRYGFIMHGLWPQNENGRNPMSCSSAEALDDALVEQMVGLMPSKRLIQHEWQKHGTCSGLGAKGYFQKARAAYAAIQIPAEYTRPAAPISATLAQIEAKFIAANPGMNADMIAVQCRGRVSEIRFCLDKNLKPRACAANVKDSCPGPVIFPPLR